MTAMLDASALIAMIKGEKGTARVATGIAGARVSSVNYAEVGTHFIHAGMPEREVDAMLDPLPLTVVPADKAPAQIAGKLRAMTAEAGLSLGDRFCLALAQRWVAGMDERPELEEDCGRCRRQGCGDPVAPRDQVRPLPQDRLNALAAVK
jgi:ribonuclease VapC